MSASPRARPELTLASIPAPSIAPSLAMEQATLGCLLISKPAVAKVIKLGLIPDDFKAALAHPRIFAAMLELADRGEPVDPLSVAETLHNKGQLESSGGRPYLTSLYEGASTPSHVEWYAQRVLEFAVRRQLASFTGDKFTNGSCDPAASIDQMLAQLQSVRKRLHTVAPVGITAAELQSKEFRPIRWAIDTFIAEGCSIFVGPEKAGKSWLALNLSLAVASGGIALGIIPVERGPVLHLALEDGERRIKSRIGEMIGHDTPWPELLTIFAEWPRMDQGGYSQLDAWLKEHPGTRLVVVDLFARVRPPATRNGDRYAEDYAAVAQFKTLADKHNCAILLIHHTNRGKSDDFVDAVSGTRGLGGAADATLVLQRLRTQNAGVLKLTGRDVEERELALTFDLNAGGWVLQGDAAQFERTREQNEILELLIEAYPKPLTAKDVTTALNIKSGTARQRLSRMALKGLLAANDGWYALPGETHVTPVTPVTTDLSAGTNHGSECVTPPGVTPCNTHALSGPQRNAVTPVTPVTGTTHATNVTALPDLTEAINDEDWRPGYAR